MEAAGHGSSDPDSLLSPVFVKPAGSHGADREPAGQEPGRCPQCVRGQHSGSDDKGLGVSLCKLLEWTKLYGRGHGKRPGGDRGTSEASIWAGPGSGGFGQEHRGGGIFKSSDWV